MHSKKKIVVTGGSGRFAAVLKTIKTNYKILYPSSRKLNITKIKSVRSYLKRKK